MVCSQKVGKFDIVVVQGSDTSDVSFYLLDDDGTPINFSTATAACHIRSQAGSSVLLDNLTTENDRISIVETDVDGVMVWLVTIKFPSIITSAYNFLSAWYDFELYMSGKVYRYLEGSVIVNPETTYQNED